MTPDRLAAAVAIVDAAYPADGAGAALLVAVNGQPALVHCRGRARVADGVPIAPDTVFDLASMGKQFTAFATLLLASRGALTPADPVHIHLPELEPLARQAYRPIRVADLLHHTSGLPDYVCGVSPRDCATFDNRQLVPWAARQRLEFTPGTQGIADYCQDTYCNTNYALLACVVERVAGRPFPDFVRDTLFAPLGMTDTFCSTAGDTHPRRAARYGEDGERLTAPREIPVYGDGNLFSTLADLAKWEAELSRPTLLDAGWLHQAFDPATLDDGRRTRYGWGWFVGRYNGRRAVWHGGSWDGTSTCYARYLDDGVSVVLCSNTRVVLAYDVVSLLEPALLD
ncbi:MAG: serine hydrolase domain-containing protein [Gemmataceae bacterium]